MIEKNVMEKLSGELSDNEREEMFHKIKRLVTQTETDSVASEQKIHSEEEKKKIIQMEISRISWIEKFFLCLTAYFSGKKREEVFIQRKLKNIRHMVNRKAPGITGFETRNLTPKLAAEVFEIYKTVLLVKGAFNFLWQKEGNFEKTVVFLLAHRIQNPKNKLEDFVTMEELVLLYGQEGQKDTLRKEILTRLMDYVENISNQEIDDAESSLEPFFYLKEITLFPFVSFFQLFGFNPAAMPEIKKPFFQNAAAMLSLKFLEKLHIAGEFNNMIREPMRVDPVIMKYFLINIQGQDEKKSSEEDSRDEDVPEVIRDEKLKTIMNDILELHRKLMKFHRQIPSLELLRYFIKDPYLVVDPKMPGLHFRDFYYMILKQAVLNEMEENFNEIRKRYIQGEIDSLFAGKRFYALQNYRRYTSIDYDKMGLPFFRHTQSINLLYNYVKTFYREFFYDTFQLLNKNILVNNRLTRERLEKYITSFEETEQRIKDFDFAISPDSEDGKLFQRLRFSLASEPSHQKLFSSMIIQKDREVKSILERGDEDISGIVKVIDELVSSPTQTIKMQLNTHYIVRGKTIILIKLLSSRRDHLNKFRNIMAQIIKNEKS